MESLRIPVMPTKSERVAAALGALPGGAAGLRRAAGGRALGLAPVFMLHRVLPDPALCYDPEMVVSTARLEQFLDWLCGNYEVAPLLQLQARLRQAGPRARPLCALTFDDGWVDTYRHAFPRLRRLRLPATVFLPVAFIGSERHFWQERLWASLRRWPAEEAAERGVAAAARFPWCPPLAAEEFTFDRLRRRLTQRGSAEAEAFVEALCDEEDAPEPAERAFMNWEEVAEMRSAGISFGSHTVEHTLLSWAPPGDAARELAHSRQDLELRLGAPVREISYPWGGMSPFTRQQAEQAGFSCAVTTQPGLVNAGTDPLRLPRIALSEAQLGGRQRRGQWDPAPLHLHLGRGRRRPPPTAPAAPTRRLQIGFLVDNPEAWGDPPEGHLGGSELQLLRLIEALNPAYFQAELYFLRPPASGLPTNLPWPAYGARSTSRGRLATIARLRRLLRRHRPDVVQSLFVDGTFLGVPAAWLAGVPAVLCARRNAGYWKRWFHHPALRVINRMANAWQVNSPVIYQMLEHQEGVPADAVEIIPNWIDLERFRPATPAERTAARADLGLGGCDFVAVCVANYSPVKDLARLVAAAEILRDKLPVLRILLVGDGPERERLERAVAAGGAGALVRLEGTSDEVVKYLAAADVGVLTSSSEGCSNAVLEYMAAGLPTVLSDIGANRALAGESFFAVGDGAGLARELQALAADPALRAQRGAENRRRAEAYGGNAFRALVQGHFLRVAARRDSAAASGKLDRRNQRGLQ